MPCARARGAIQAAGAPPRGAATHQAVLHPGAEAHAQRLLLRLSRAGQMRGRGAASGGRAKGAERALTRLLRHLHGFEQRARRGALPRPAEQRCGGARVSFERGGAQRRCGRAAGPRRGARTAAQHARGLRKQAPAELLADERPAGAIGGAGKRAAHPRERGHGRTRQRRSAARAHAPACAARGGRLRLAQPYEVRRGFVLATTSARRVIVTSLVPSDARAAARAAAGCSHARRDAGSRLRRALLAPHLGKAAAGAELAARLLQHSQRQQAALR